MILDQPFSAPYRVSTLGLILAASVLAWLVLWVASAPWCVAYGVSPLVLGVFLGLALAPRLRPHLPQACEPGLTFVAKDLLRWALVFYGFRISLQQIMEVGLAGVVISLLIVVTTVGLGLWIGRRWLGMDRDVVLLTAAGSAVCGAAAVIATEAVLRSPAAKGTVALGTVVLFGSLAMLVYPLAFKAGLIGLDDNGFGMYVGATVHEVAQVVAVGTTVSPSAADTAVIVKMTRVILLAPLLLLLGTLTMSGETSAGNARRWIPPWFVLGFIAVVMVTSLQLIPQGIVRTILEVDSFVLTMAMIALGFSTRLGQVREAGLKPLFLALVLFMWLVVGGYGMTAATLTLLPTTS